ENVTSTQNRQRSVVAGGAHPQAACRELSTVHVEVSMTLILLAIVLTIAFCIVAYNLAIYALPFWAALVAAQHTWTAGAGFMMSAFAAIAAALLSIAVVIAVLGFAKNSILRLIALA